MDLIRISLAFVSGILCGYLLSWQPTLRLSNHIQHILSETKTAEAALPVNCLPATIPPTHPPTVQGSFFSNDSWIAPSLEDTQTRYPVSYSIAREYDIMKRWMSIKEYPSIPKIIHQVWVGSTFENAYCKWMDSFRVEFVKNNPSWTYKLWNRELYEKTYGTMVLGKEFDREPKVESKADILRYEVLWREGGIYLDADSIWLEKPFDHLLDVAKPFGMFTVGHHDKFRSNGINVYMNGVFGVSKCHPAMEHVLRNLQLLYADLYYEQQADFFDRTGPFFFSNALRHFPVALVSRDVFSPGSWFFDASGDTFDNVLRRRIDEMKKQFPDALTFQVGFNTHNKPDSEARNCTEWAKDIELILRTQNNNVSSLNDSEDLTCGSMDYANITAPQSLPPKE